ncbi:hypothetical protein [Vibrio splendidus]|uniref:hypothetical protein n=1 Tax=Vibrio splendidus TaxID=29497 RepID=UPI0015E779D4|nr:hypothetical protein [Vibrio splendidus]
MSDDKQQQNKGYQPEKIEEGYQPQSDSSSDNERFGYQPPENNTPSNVSTPPEDE